MGPKSLATKVNEKEIFLRALLGLPDQNNLNAKFSGYKTTHLRNVLLERRTEVLLKKAMFAPRKSALTK